MEEAPKCLWDIFREASGSCCECDYLDSCLMEAVLLAVQEETEYPSFKKRLEEAINRADIIWKNMAH
jgi:hypothetical protein